jgi:hypothetical protein
MSNNFFEESTVALGTIYTIFVLSVIVSILVWG